MQDQHNVLLFLLNKWDEVLAANLIDIFLGCHFEGLLRVCTWVMGSLNRVFRLLKEGHKSIEGGGRAERSVNE